MDYQKLCIELFGTDDEDELRILAQKLKKNARGAGRPQKFTPEQIDRMHVMLADGKRPAEIAAYFGTTPQLINRHLNQPIRDGCTLRMQYMHRNKVCSIIDVDFANKKIYVDNRTNDIYHRAFGAKEDPDWNDFEYFLQDRCYEKNRADIKQILRNLGLDFYDPLSILEKTNGRNYEDNMWIKFSYATNQSEL